MTPFRSLMWCDDLVVVEPLLGLLPWMSLGLAEGMMTNLLGDAALNIPNDHAEGSPELTKIAWGLHYSTTKRTRELCRHAALTERIKIRVR